MIAEPPARWATRSLPRTGLNRAASRMLALQVRRFPARGAQPPLEERLKALEESLPRARGSTPALTAQTRLKPAAWACVPRLLIARGSTPALTPQTRLNPAGRVASTPARNGASVGGRLG
ncbi:MAG: hypothetical protein KatS3mg059_0733 [Thermomicrobiales bacterium]|nr:MAG: hypothetical protein KatS3mg059_0733 [Thermomicrobiales bacterium]